MPLTISATLGICNTMGSGAFTPLSLGAACVEWWDARTSAQLTLGGGNAISAWMGKKSAYNLVQATGSLQPSWDAGGFVKFDASDDYLTLTLAQAIAQGQIYVSTPYGWYKSGVGNWTANTHRIASADVSQIVFVDAAVISAGQRYALETYLGTQQYWIIKTGSTSILNRLDNTPDVNRTLVYMGANAANYSLASSQAGATIDVGAQGLTAPVHMSWPAPIGADATLTDLRCNGDAAIGMIPDFSGNSALTAIRLYTNKLTGPIPTFTVNPALQYYNCTGNQLSGNIPSLNSNPALQSFFCNNNILTGSIPTLSMNIALQQVNFGTNQLTGYAGGGVSATLTNFIASTNQLPVAAINALLADFVAAGASNGTLSIGGVGNAAPTGQGLTDKTTLQSRGWTVTTN